MRFRARISLKDYFTRRASGVVRCWLCGERARRFTLDHIAPRSLGGTNAAWNLAPAHAACNNDRGPSLAVPDAVVARLSDLFDELYLDGRRGHLG